MKTYSERLKEEYRVQKYNSGNRWPRFVPQEFTKLSYVFHEPIRTPEETENSAKRSRSGSYCSSSEYISRPDCKLDSTSDDVFTSEDLKEDISDIFLPTRNKLQIILAEGAPGIGKTMLLKEIAYLWATGVLLKNKEIILLLSLRDPKIGIIDSPKKMFYHHCKDKKKAQIYANYFYNNSGEGLVILLDGLDESLTAMQKGSFLFTLISKGYYSKACIVITSRPHATIEIQEYVSYRIEIIGFNMEKRQEFVKKNSKYGIAVELEEYLKSHPVIDTLCHIPLNLSILLCLFKEKQKLGKNYAMPKTQTELIKKAVEMTVSHNLDRMGLTVKQGNIDNLCEPYKEIFYNFCTLAYKALIENKLTFTSDEINTACPVDPKGDKNIKNAIINCFGLIQAAQFFTSPHFGDSETVSNFVHFAVQEFLAAWYVSFWNNRSLLSFPHSFRKCIHFYKQQSELSEKFWKGQYINMWSLHIGITGANDPAFKYFLSGNHICCTHNRQFSISQTILSNKIKTISLYLCLQEAPDNEFIDQLGEVIGDNCLDLNNEKLSMQGIELLGNILSRYYLAHQWQLVNLTHCNINDDKFKSLEAILTRLDGRPKPGIRTLSLCYNSLKFCGKSIARLVQNLEVIRLNLSWNTVEDFSYFKSCILLETIDISNNSLKEKSLGLFKTLKHLKRLITLKLNNNDIGNDEHLVDAICLGLCHCDSLRTLELEGNDIEDTAMVIFETINIIRNNESNRIYFRMSDRAVALIRILCHYNCSKTKCLLWEKLNSINAINISRNGLQNSHAISLARCLHVLESLESLDISKNKISNESAKELTKGIILATKLKQFEYDQTLFDEQKISVFKMIFDLRNSKPSRVFKCVPSVVLALVFILNYINEINELQDHDTVYSNDIVKILNSITELDMKCEVSSIKLNDDIIKLVFSFQLFKWFGKLEAVYLTNNNVTAEATESLVLVMIQIPTFKQLELAGNPIINSTSSMLTFAIIKDLQERKLSSFICNQDSNHQKCKSILFIMECLHKEFVTGCLNNAQGKLKNTKSTFRNLKDHTFTNDVANLIIHSSDCKSSEKLVNYIKFLPGLRSLDVSGTTIPECGMIDLSACLTVNFKPDLSCSNLQSHEVQGIMMNSLIKCARFNDCNITNKVLPRLAQILVSNNLDVLELEGNCFDSQGINDFHNIITQNQNTFITSLNLSNNNLNQTSAKHIIEIIKVCKVKHLDVSHNSLTMLLSYFENENITTLEELDISYNIQQTEGEAEFIQSIINLKNCKSLKRLNISNNFIDQNAVFHMYSYFMNSANLEEIICDNNPATVGIKVAFHLLKNLRSRCVKSIDLKGHPAAVQVFISAVSSGVEGMHGPFATLLDAHAGEIKQIDLSFSELQVDESLVSVLKKFTNLQMLDLSGNSITDESFKHVATGLLFAFQLKIKNLYLKGNPCNNNRENCFILEIIEDLRSANKNFVCLPEKFNAFLFVLELLDKINSEKNDLCKAISLVESIDISYPVTTSCMADKENFSKFVKLSSVNAKRFHVYLKHFKSLKFINIGGNFKSVSQAIADYCDRKTQLKIAIFNNSDVTEDLLQNLTTSVLIDNDLDILEISGNHFGDNGFCKTILACKQMYHKISTKIASLNLSSNDLTSCSVPNIMEIVYACKVKGLNISHNCFWDGIFQYVRILNITTLEDLDVTAVNRQTSFGIQFARSISYLNTCNLKTLNISSNCIDVDAIPSIMCSFINCIHLNEIICDGNPAENEIKFTFDLVKRIYDHKKSLESITFRGYPATASAFISVVANKSSLLSEFVSSVKFHANQVKEINLSCSNLQIDESFIAVLKTFSTLQVLNLCENNITDEGFKFVAAGFLFTSRLNLVNLNLDGNPCISNEENHSILKMIEKIRSSCKDFKFVCLPTNFKTFLHVLELVDLVNSEESDVCKIIFSMKSLNASHSDIVNAFNASKGSNNIFVKISSADAKEFCLYLKHFKSLETLYMVGNDIKEDARDNLVTSILKNSSIFEIQFERNPLCKKRRTSKLFATIAELQNYARNYTIPFPFKDRPATLQAYVDLLHCINGFEDKSCDLVVKTEHLKIREFYQQQKNRFYGIENIDNPQDVITGFVAHLKLFCNLKTLDLCSTCLTVRALRKLSTFLCSSETLQELDISQNNIKVEGALIILKSLDPATNKALQCINMAKNGIEGRMSEEVAIIVSSLAIKIVLKGNKLSEKSKELLKANKV